MGLLGGAFNAVKGVAKIATAPARTALKIAGTGLATGGAVLGNLATGNVGGAAGAVVDGVKQQAGNVSGYFTENVDSVRQIAGGHGEFIQGGLSLIGEPIKGAARLTGNSLATAGNTVSSLAVGDLNGAGQAVGEGFSNGAHIVGDTFSNQASNLF